MVSLRNGIGRVSGRISTKLVTSLLVLAIVFLSLAAYSVEVGKRSLEEAIGSETVELAHDFAKAVDRGIYSKLHEMIIIAMGNHMRGFLVDSNAEFEAMADPELYIDQQDEAWMAVPEGELSSFMEDILANNLSADLTNRLDEHYIREHGIDVYGEVQVSNKYGALVAMTSKSFDYRQSDEGWWQVTVQEGRHIGEVERDPVTGAYSISISITVTDAGGEFLGVMKAFVGSTEVVMEAQFETRVFETTEVDILTPDGRLVYSTHAFNTYEDLSSEEYVQRIEGDSGYFTSEEAGRERLYSYSASEGYIEYEGSNWIFLMSHDTAEVFEPVTTLRFEILAVSTFLMLAFLAVALVLSASVTSPVERLKLATQRMASGHFDERVSIKSRDEFGDLAQAFNGMASELGGLYADLEGRVQERSKEVDAANAKLQILGSITRHDALNQLSVLRGWLSMVEDGTSDPKLLEYIHKVTTASETLEEQLKFTGTYEKVGVTKPEWVDAKLALDTSLPGLELKGATLSNGLDGLVVYADPMFPKVLRNLAENSVKHGKGTKRISYSYRELPDGAVMIIEDDGGGISPERKGTLFERARDDRGRVGYGLYLSKAILDITGITIEETGTPGVGAKFVLKVPKGKYRISGPQAGNRGK